MSLRTGKQIHAKQWTELPVTDEVVQRVEELADAAQIPEMVNGELLFEWAPGNPIVQDDTSDITTTLLNTPLEHGNTGHKTVIFDNIDPEGAEKIDEANTPMADSSETIHVEDKEEVTYETV